LAQLCSCDQKRMNRRTSLLPIGEQLDRLSNIPKKPRRTKRRGVCEETPKEGDGVFLLKRKAPLSMLAVTTRTKLLSGMSRNSVGGGH